jgi:type I restriction enzyme S subunit
MGIAITPNWEVRKIGSLTDVFAGGTPSTQIDNYWGGDIRWMNSGELNLRKVFEVENRITEEGLRNSSARVIPTDCVLIGLAGQGKTRGTVAINRVELTTNQSVAAIYPSKYFVPEYLYYNLDLRYNEIRDLSDGGGGRGGLNLKLIKSIEIPLPGIEEQKAIAKALSDIDELIETLKSEIIKSKNLHTAVIQKLLPANFLKNRLPNGWKLRPLGELGTISGAGVDKVSRSSDVPIKLLNYMDVHRNTFVTPAIDFMDTTATKDQIRNCSLIKGDVLFTPTSETPDDIARSSVVLSDFRDTCYSYHLIRFRPKIRLDLNYLAFVFLLEDFRLQAQKAAEGSGTRYVITLPRFRSLLIPIPDIKIQNEIGQAVNDINNQIESLKNELEKYRQLKSGMAQDLLTGKVRLV